MKQEYYKQEGEAKWTRHDDDEFETGRKLKFEEIKHKKEWIQLGRIEMQRKCIRFDVQDSRNTIIYEGTNGRQSDAGKKE
jgi:hypothetical protein